ncbi:MAG: tetratricopeptide repeat protein [Verrucomicrobiales bacterium]|nr:tetratricopeptide repeat protein [Verrucomicrobiales bacterium]
MKSAPIYLTLIPLFSILCAQEPSGEVTSPVAETVTENVDAKDLFLSLAGTAADGDETVANELTTLILKSGGVSIPASLQKQGVPKNPSKAREVLAELLLSSGNQALWPAGHSWLDRSVQDESVASIERQAVILLNGSQGREKSIPQAIDLLKRAKQLPGATQAHFLLGNLASRGIGMPQDGAIALAHFRDGAKAGSIPCLVGLHQLYREGGIIEKDLEEAATLGKRASDLGSADAAYEMGIFYERFAAEESNWEEAAKWLRLASERGHSGASTRLASYHMSSKLGESDPEKSIALCRLAAEQGDAEACFMIAKFYAEGTSLPRDLVASTAWLQVAAGRGHVPAQNELGMRLTAGMGVSRNIEAAAGWFVEAAKKGFPAAMVNLGEILENGVGVEQNLAEARKLYEAAAKSNHPGGQTRLARMLARGSATGAPDPVGAAYWASRSAQIEENAKPLASQLREALSETQKGELDRRLEAAEPR